MQALINWLRLFVVVYKQVIYKFLITDLVFSTLMACLLSYFYSYISPFIMRHLLLSTCKQGCLQTCEYDQSLSIMETYIPTKFHDDIVYVYIMVSFFEL